MIIPIHNSTYSIQWELSNRNNGDMRKEHTLEHFLKEKQMGEYSYILAQQIHDTSVRSISADYKKQTIRDVDGLVSSISLIDPQDITLAIRTADCVPILLYDEFNGVIGAAHSGWKGTYSNIAASTVSEMIVQGASIEHISAVLGPHIHACCYSVDTPRGENFQKKYGSESVHKVGNVYFLHLDAVITQQLTALGVQPQNIAVSTQCTSTLNDLYFSYRKDSVTTFGEQIAIIGLKKVQ